MISSQTATFFSLKISSHQRRARSLASFAIRPPCLTSELGPSRNTLPEPSAWRKPDAGSPGSSAHPLGEQNARCLAAGRSGGASASLTRQVDRKRFAVDPETSSNDQKLDQVRRAALVEWEAMAPGWERRREYLREFSQGVTDWMVAQLDPQPGQTILELGAGTGETGFAAARLVGDSGRLISTDLPTGMVEVAKRRAKELGVANAEFRVVDAEHIDLEDGSVDGILCRWAYMLMPDPPAALAESRRVLRPGGRLALAVMGGPAQNPWATSVAKSIVGLGLVPPIDPRAAGGVFSLADPDR